MFTIGSRIRYLREQNGLSMKALSEQITKSTGIKVSSGQISDWENGNKNPSADGLIALSTFFQVSADWILTGREGLIDKRGKLKEADKKAFIEGVLEGIEEAQREEQTPSNDKGSSALFFRDEWETTSHFEKLIRELDGQDRAFIKRFIELVLLEKRHKNEEAAAREEHAVTSVQSKQDQPETSAEHVEETLVPLVGKTAAGIEKTYYEFIRGYVPIPKDVIKGTCFVLEVDGDSMNGDGIEHGDFVVIKQQPVVENGDIALLRIEDEITLKRIQREGGQIILVSSNPAYPKRAVPERNVQVVGKYIYKIRGEEGMAKLREEPF